MLADARTRAGRWVPRVTRWGRDTNDRIVPTAGKLTGQASSRRDRIRAHAAANRPACGALPSRCTRTCRATAAAEDNTRARSEPGSHNHHHDRAAVRAFYAVRDFDWWAGRRMSVAVFFAATSWAGSVPDNLDQVDRAPARNTACIQTLLRR